MGDESFALIEKKISDLVQVVGALKKEKEILAGEVSRKDGEVKDRVEKILSRLDTIEL